MPSPYVYSPLDRSRLETRIFTVQCIPRNRILDRLPFWKRGQGGSGNEELDTLSISVETISLERPTGYIAISYACGDVNAKKPVLFNGGEAQIYASLYQALRAIARFKRFKKTKFWADAVSINQQDDTEKSWQVAQLAEVYKHASGVLVWLGTAEGSSDTTIRRLRELTNTVERYKKDKYQPYSGRSALLPWEDDLAALYPKLPVWFDEGLRDFFRRPWWERVWTVQESVLAHNLTFFWGNQVIPYSHVLGTMEAVSEARRVAKDRGASSDDDWGAEFYAYNDRPAIQLRNRHQLVPESLALRHLLVATSCTDHVIGETTVRFLGAWDPRDRVYGLLSLATDRGSLELHLDYTKSTQEVYTDVARALLVQGHVDMLSLCNQSESLLGLPTWAIDWSVPIRIYKAMHWSSRFLNINFMREGFAPSGGIGHCVRLTPNNGNVISVRGMRVDHISSFIHPNIDALVKGSVDDRQTWIDLLRQYLDAALDFLSNRQSAYASQQVLLQAIVSTTKDVASSLLGEWWTDGYFAHIRFDDEQLASSASRLLNSNNPITLQDSQVKNIVETSEGSTSSSAMEDDTGAFQAFLEMFRKATADHRLFASQLGYIGLGPTDSQAGDLICILYGATVPFVLREAGQGNYRVIGEAYVQSIMQGELMEKNLESTDFLLI